MSPTNGPGIRPPRSPLVPMSLRLFFPLDPEETRATKVPVATCMGKADVAGPSAESAARRGIPNSARTYRRNPPWFPIKIRYTFPGCHDSQDHLKLNSIAPVLRPPFAARPKFRPIGATSPAQRKADACEKRRFLLLCKFCVRIAHKTCTIIWRPRRDAAQTGNKVNSAHTA